LGGRVRKLAPIDRRIKRGKWKESKSESRGPERTLRVLVFVGTFVGKRKKLKCQKDEPREKHLVGQCHEGAKGTARVSDEGCSRILGNRERKRLEGEERLGGEKT